MKITKTPDMIRGSINATTAGGIGGVIITPPGPGTGGGSGIVSSSSNTASWQPIVSTITSNTSNVLGPNVNFASGSNIAFSVTSNTLTIHATAGTIDHGSLAGLEDDDHSAYLKARLGGAGDVQALGTLGAGPITIQIANANLFWGTLDQDVTIGFTGWTNIKDVQITVLLYEDGTGGWTPTFSGVTWDGGLTPTHDTTAGTLTRYVFTSIDGGTTIIGAMTGGGGPDTSLVTVAATGATETVDVSVARTYDLTLTAATVTLTLSGALTAEAWFATLILRQDATGGRQVTWPASVTWPGGDEPALSAAPNAVDFVVVVTVNGGTTWYGFLTGSGSSSSGYHETVTNGDSSDPECLYADGDIVVAFVET